MAAKRFSLLKTNTEEKEIIEPKIEKRDDMPIMDKKVIEFTVKNFQDPGNKIINSLLNLQNTLEESIDFIEDKSNELIKSERNFKLSGEYRQNSIRLHEISTSILKYIDWMESIKPDNITEIPITELSANDSDSDKVTVLDSTEINKESKSLYEDLTGKIPTAFKLYKHIIEVDSWEDLSVKTADLLIKNYKQNKYNENITFQVEKAILKNSTQNDFRDTIIEMLLEYKIDPLIYHLYF